MEGLCLHFLGNLLARGKRKTENRAAKASSTEIDATLQRVEFKDPVPDFVDVRVK